VECAVRLPHQSFDEGRPVCGQHRDVQYTHVIPYRWDLYISVKIPTKKPTFVSLEHQNPIQHPPCFFLFAYVECDVTTNGPKYMYRSFPSSFFTANGSEINTIIIITTNYTKLYLSPPPKNVVMCSSP
jgi:hypothetical protein